MRKAHGSNLIIHEMRQSAARISRYDALSGSAVTRR
jgi:hypothetical protein